MMCSIPGLPTPGAAVPVLVTRVNLKPSGGLVELWVDLNVERKQDYEQMNRDIEIPEKTLCGSEGKPGDLCLVRIIDTWHRARIVSIQSETCSVFLIDQGQLHVSTCQALAWAPNDSFLLPPKTESCILANVFSTEDEWPERATKFLMSLSGKIFHGVVQHVLMPDRIIILDIPIVSKHICKAGVAKKIPKGDFKSLVLKCLNLPKDHPSDTGWMTQDQNVNGSCEHHKTDQYFYPELLNGSYEHVSVTEATGPRNIFCKLLIFSRALKTQSDEMQRHYDEPADSGEAPPWICGHPCAARGKDGRWHRSRLTQGVVTSDGAVTVLHVDEGTTELVPVADIRMLHGKFLRMPVVTYCCWINGVDDGVTGWTAEHTGHLKSLLLNRKVVARFRPNDTSPNVYDVDLFALNGVCINDCFLEDGRLSPPRTERQLNGLNDTSASSLISLHQDDRSADIQIKKQTVSEETSPSTEEQFNGTADDAPTPVTSDPPIYPSGQLSSCCPVELQDAPPDDVFAVGSTVDVKVSCIESPQRFWCQTPENANSLKLIMEGLQNLYASAYPLPLVESICVAHDPESGMWHRAKIVTSPRCPEVEVRLIDYGPKRKVSLGDLRPIDPAFLQFPMQAFQCSLFDPTPDNGPAVTETEAASAEFQTFVDSAVSSHAGLQCIVKARTCDEEGLMVSVVDLITPSHSACELLARKRAPAAPDGPPADGYNYSTFDISVGGEEKVWVTASETVQHFYCQLERNSHVFDEVQENVKQVIVQTQPADQHRLTLNSVCLARFTDGKWYRGQVVEMSPRLRVHFVDYGDTLERNASDLRPYPAGGSVARSVPVLAVPLALLDVPDDVPQEVNRWFGDHSVGCTFTISVVAKGERGKLIVQLFDDSVNVNVKVVERIARTKERPVAGRRQQDREPDEEQRHATSPSGRMTEGHSSNQRRPGDELKMNSHSAALVCASDVEQERRVEEVRTPPVDEPEGSETVWRENSIPNVLTDLHPPTCLNGNGNSCSYTKPNVCLNKTQEGYASCIVGPSYFWCQSADTDTLNMVSMLAQEVGQTHQDQVFSETVGRGSPCLALFSSDNKWYRAQVIRRTDKTLHVLFVDYGNESDVDMEDVRSVPRYLLEQAPQAFLCSLHGFDEAEGSWEDGVYDDFYNRLVDKPLRVTAVVNMEDREDVGVPQYAVETECEGESMNALVQRYWKPAVEQCIPTENPHTETPCSEVQTDSSIARAQVKTCMFTKLQMSKKQTDSVYASCIVGPSFFWCQYATTEELSDMSRLAQEAAEAQQDVTFTETLGAGGPCLALFDSDSRWHRAQVTHRESDRVHVVFVDYGNECDVDIEDVRSVPRYLLEQAPQAFLCSLTGFDEADGSWDDGVYDDFYNLLVDKRLRVTNVFDMGDHKQIAVPQYAVELECEGAKVNAAMQRYWKPVARERTSGESPHTETCVPNVQTDASMNKATVNPRVYKKPQVSQNKAETVYASCIVGPSFFWCQYAATEELSKVSGLAQEAAEAQQDVTFTETLGAGGPCLALFDSDSRWHRAQVIRRVDDKFCVVFIDYGNESDVDIKDVRSVPPDLLEQAPQAFLCSLNGFDEADGSWDDGVYDDFYNLLVDKPLEVSVFNQQDHSEIAVPQYAVEIKYQGAVVNEVMEKYWKRLS